MKQKEIMIGDWVNFLIDITGGETEYDSQIAEYQPMQIVSISSWANNDGEVESKEGVICEIEQLNPIPITSEILEKNFPSTTDWYYIGTDKFCFRIDKHKDKWDLYFGRDGKGTNLQIKISYVHELQHALRLCGIDKEIKV